MMAPVRRIGLLAGVDADGGEALASGELHSGNVIIRLNSRHAALPTPCCIATESTDAAGASRPAACGAGSLALAGAISCFDTWPGRLFLVAAALKLARRRPAARRRACPGRSSCSSSAATIGLIVSVGYFVWRLFVLMKRRLLWRVRRKLILSYIFIGVVPALLIIAFFLLGAWVVSMNVSAYLFSDGYDDMVDDAGLGGQRRGGGDRAESCDRRRDRGARAAECQHRRPAIPPAVDRLRADRRRGAAAACGPASGAMPRAPDRDSGVGDGSRRRFIGTIAPAAGGARRRSPADRPRRGARCSRTRAASAT